MSYLVIFFMYLPIHSLFNISFTYLLTYIHTYLLTYLLTYLPTYLLTYFLTYSMEQSPSWETNRFSDSQEIPHVLWNPMVYYLIHKFPPTLSILSKLDPVHIHTNNFLKIHVIIILATKSGLPSGLFPSGFPTKTLYKPLLSLIRATCPANLINLDFITRTILD